MSITRTNEQRTIGRAIEAVKIHKIATRRRNRAIVAALREGVAVATLADATGLAQRTIRELERLAPVRIRRSA